MTDVGETARSAETSQQPLLVVVKGLLNEPPLLFGIGAGIVLVGILAATTSIVIVAIVAAIFVAALGAWLYRETRAQVAAAAAPPRAVARVNTDDAEIAKRAKVGDIKAAGPMGGLETDVQAQRARIDEDASVGTIDIGGSSERDRV
jgi:hypothetical protein